MDAHTLQLSPLDFLEFYSQPGYFLQTHTYMHIELMDEIMEITPY